LDGPEEINEKLKQYFGQTTEESTGIDQISLGTLEGRFLRNEHTGEIFLIRGEAINNFNQPRSAIQVKGVLYDQHGKPLMQKTVFCGNPISDEQLRTLPFDELEQMMGNQFGKDLSNMKVDPRRSIPSTLSSRICRLTLPNSASTSPLPARLPSDCQRHPPSLFYQHLNTSPQSIKKAATVNNSHRFYLIRYENDQACADRIHRTGVNTSATIGAGFCIDGVDIAFGNRVDRTGWLAGATSNTFVRDYMSHGFFLLKIKVRYHQIRLYPRNRWHFTRS
jgi:hypothetical protein